ncbi:MAG: YidH family protein [Solirubrobacterales bacterium]
MGDSQQPLKPDPDPAQLVDASRRTYLAGERTQLAWWRTGLTALAVALGVGRVVPELSPHSARWPYVIAGVGFALWGILALGYGTANRNAMEKALREGRFHEATAWPLVALTVSGVALGLLTALLILLD